MTWECAECNSDDRQYPIAGICHHCGKPLCREDRVLIADDAFAALTGDANQVAVHCRTCKREHHPAGVSLSRERR